MITNRQLGDISSQEHIPGGRLEKASRFAIAR